MKFQIKNWLPIVLFLGSHRAIGVQDSMPPNLRTPPAKPNDVQAKAKTMAQAKRDRKNAKRAAIRLNNAGVNNKL